VLFRCRTPLFETLFTRLPKNAKTAKHGKDLQALANNGWIWNADPLLDFASPGSRTYMRRDLIVWGDCVKLQFGKKREDNPWLWDHMTRYVENLASMFDGFRLDNCHSTPLEVGAYLMDKARAVNPNLYVCAELFTGNQDLDMLWVCKFGINSLIREAYSELMLCWRIRYRSERAELTPSCRRQQSEGGERPALRLWTRQADR
jgi:glycogen debranching enzyme